MKIILSRKGFDSKWGGCPSPILPDGRLISLPIPLQDPICYSELKFDDSKLKNIGLKSEIKTYYDLMEELGHKLLTKETCHLDPDIRKEVLAYRKVGWMPSFGQDSNAQTHLKNQYVDKDDLFLFFGWFRETEIDKDGKLMFKKNAPDLHVIFGYLQIGKIMTVNGTYETPDWMECHPHTSEERRRKKNNTIYVASERFSLDKSYPGAGVFKFNEALVLTKDGLSRSKWDLPSCFKNTEISYHIKSDPWRKGYFQSVAIGQEFVVKDNEDVVEWAKKLLQNRLISVKNINFSV